MSGGTWGLARTLRAQTLALRLSGSLLVAIAGAGTNVALADDPCAVEPQEKSILVGSAVASDDPNVVAASDEEGGEPLEPIATTSSNEPDPAEPPVDAYESRVPELDEEYYEDVTDGIDEELAVAGDRGARRSDAAEAASLPADPGVTIQASSFHGVTPGVTTRAEVLRAWGQPAAGAGSASRIVYSLENFPVVTITLTADRVESLRIELPTAIEPDVLIEKLGLATVPPAEVVDLAGIPVSTTFPERGVTFVHRASDTSTTVSDEDDPMAVVADHRVRVLVLRPIGADAFVLRALHADPNNYGDRIDDLETALRYDIRSVDARALLAQIKLAVGSAVTAEQLAREAVDLQPRNDDNRLLWARCLTRLARYDEAVEQTRLVLESTSVTPLLRAQALGHMGALAALGSRDVQQRAIPLQEKAIEQADQLVTSDDDAIRIPAQQTLVDAHLAIAERVAAGDWEEKAEFVGQWIARASALSEQLVQSGEADVSLRLQVAQTALVAGAKLKPPIDPAPWIIEAEQAVRQLQSETDDEQAGANLDWQLGLAYLYAAEISHRRVDAAAALKYGALAEQALKPALGLREQLPDTDFVLGRLYFQIGAVHAVHRADHEKACQWYDRAISLLSRPAPVTALATPGMHGDALVSMAVSYWEVGDRERAYQLTAAGVELVEQGVDEGLLAPEAIDVPRSNFLAMSRALGKINLATPAEATQVASDQPTTTPATQQASRGSQTQRQQQVRTATRRNAAGSPMRRR